MPKCRHAALMLASVSPAIITNSTRASFSPQTDQDIFVPPCTQCVTYVLIITCYLCPESGPPLSPELLSGLLCPSPAEPFSRLSSPLPGPLLSPQFGPQFRRLPGRLLHPLFRQLPCRQL